MDSQSLSSLNTALNRHLECPICFELCQPPIFICINGHNVCGECQRKLTECAICRGPKPVGRNLFAEALSAKVKQPPRVSCWARVQDGVECSWRGPVAELVNHVVNCHPKRISYGDITRIAWKYNTSLLTHRISLVDSHDSLFWIVFCIWPDNSIVYVTVRRVASPSDANFRFTLRMSSPDGEQQLCFSSAVAELKERGDLTHRALRLHSDVLHTFASGGRLRCEVLVERVGRDSLGKTQS